MKKGIFIVIVAFSAVGSAPASAQMPVARANAFAVALGPEAQWSTRWPTTASLRIAGIPRADSSSGRHWRATLVGGLVGGVVGGLAAAAYVLNATAYRCTTVGPTCPNNNRTTRRVFTITAGSLSGAAFGALVGHTFARRQ
jgi:hypothetical protein